MIDTSRQLPGGSVTVIESMYSISGVVFSILECRDGMLDVGVIIRSVDGVQWKVTENNLLIGRRNDARLQKLVADNDYFFYRLDPIGHSKKPDTNAVLQVLT